MARTQHPREVVPNSELGCGESSSCHLARPTTNASGAAQDEQCTCEREKDRWTRAGEEPQIRAVNTSVRHPERIGASRMRAV